MITFPTQNFAVPYWRSLRSDSKTVFRSCVITSCPALHFLLHYQHSKATSGRAKYSLGRLEVNHSPALQMCVNVQPQNAHAHWVVSVLPLPVLFLGARKELKLTRTLFSLCLKSSSLAYFIPLLVYYSWASRENTRTILCAPAYQQWLALVSD